MEEAMKKRRTVGALVCLINCRAQFAYEDIRSPAFYIAVYKDQM